MQKVWRWWFKSAGLSCIDFPHFIVRLCFYSWGKNKQLWNSEKYLLLFTRLCEVFVLVHTVFVKYSCWHVFVKYLFLFTHWSLWSNSWCSHVGLCKVHVLVPIGLCATKVVKWRHAWITAKCFSIVFLLLMHGNAGIWLSIFPSAAPWSSTKSVYLMKTSWDWCPRNLLKSTDSKEAFPDNEVDSVSWLLLSSSWSLWSTCTWTNT